MDRNVIKELFDQLVKKNKGICYLNKGRVWHNGHSYDNAELLGYTNPDYETAGAYVLYVPYLFGQNGVIFVFCQKAPTLYLDSKPDHVVAENLINDSEFYLNCNVEKEYISIGYCESKDIRKKDNFKDFDVYKKIVMSVHGAHMMSTIRTLLYYPTEPAGD